MDKSPDPLPQIEAALDKLIWALHAGPYGEEKTALLALIRSAIGPQPAQGELRTALERIAAIEDRMIGGDWDEIEEARTIAREALK